MSKWIRIIAALACLATGASAHAQLLTEGKVFTLPQYTTVGGKTLKNLRVGYQSYGRLNAASDNAIFISHSWDDAIGPGKPFDTDRYFVLTAGTLDIDGRDLVHVQKALADSLGIKRFAAVAGPSTGPLQVMEWAATYPDMVARAIAVVPGGLLLFYPEYGKEMAAKLKAQGTNAEDGFPALARTGEVIRAFLEQNVRAAYDRDFDFD